MDPKYDRFSVVSTADRREIAVIYCQAPAGAGDWWNYYRLGEYRTLVFIGDVTGHGIGSAMVASMVRGYLDGLTDFFWHGNVVAKPNSSVSFL